MYMDMSRYCRIWAKTPESLNSLSQGILSRTEAKLNYGNRFRWGFEWERLVVISYHKRLYNWRTTWHFKLGSQTRTRFISVLHLYWHSTLTRSAVPELPVFSSYYHRLVNRIHKQHLLSSILISKMWKRTHDSKNRCWVTSGNQFIIETDGTLERRQWLDQEQVMNFEVIPIPDPAMISLRRWPGAAIERRVAFV